MGDPSPTGIEALSPSTAPTHDTPEEDTQSSDSGDNLEQSQNVEIVSVSTEQGAAPVKPKAIPLHRKNTLDAADSACESSPRLSSARSSASSCVSRSSSQMLMSPRDLQKRNKKADKQQRKALQQLANINLKGLCAYVPQVLYSNIKDKSKLVQEEVTFKAASLFIDMCRYTFITEQMRKSEDGSNGIATHLNKFFSLLLSQVARYEGDVLQFSGDALLAIWRCDDEDGEDLASMATRALLCAEGLLTATLDQHIQFSPNDPPIRLGVHMSLGVGAMTFYTLGGVGNSWRFMTTGPGVLDSVTKVDLAKMDEIALSPAAHELVSHLCRAEPVSDGEGCEGFKFSSLVDGREAQPSLHSPTSDVTHRGAVHSEEVDSVDEEVPLGGEESITESAKYRVYCFLFDTILSTWGKEGELRTVSTLFIHFLQNGRPNAIADIQSTLEVIQAELALRDGVLNKVLCDDKGVTLLCIFGLPGHAHEDDALRSLTFANNTKLRVEEKGQVALAYGISRAKVYCGQCGSKARREYTVLGDGVNVAARVMQHAARQAKAALAEDENGELESMIFCDDVTKVQAKEAFVFTGGEEIKVKGKTMGTKLWEVVDSTRQSLRAGSRNSLARMSPGRMRVSRVASCAESLDVSSPGSLNRAAPPPKMVGRDALLRAVRDVVTKVARRSTKDASTPPLPPKTRTMLVLGEAGIGKSLFVRTLGDNLRTSAGITVLHAQCSSMEADNEFFLMSLLFQGMASRDLAWLAEDIDAVDSDLRPLLNYFFPELYLEENDRVVMLGDKERLGALLDIAVGLVMRAFEGQCVLITVDDLQFADESSQVALKHIIDACERSALVLTKRQDAIGDDDDDDDDDDDNVDSEDVFPMSACTRVNLKPLKKQDCVHLLRRVLRAPVHELVVETVYRKGGGNPGFSEQILSALLDATPPVLVVAENRAMFAPGVDVNNLELPDGIEGVISSRVDRLAPTSQWYLKVASVIGTVFSLDLLSRALHVDPEDVLAQFSDLEKQGFVAQKKASNKNKGKNPNHFMQISASRSSLRATDVIYTFKLQLMSDVLYQMLLPRERREIHITVARELEQDLSNGMNTEPQVLIFHFRKGGLHAKALKYLGEAAEKSLEKGRPHATVQHLTQAFQIHKQAEEDAEAAQAASAQSKSMSGPTEDEPQIGQEEYYHWHALLAQGLCGIGAFERVAEHAHTVLEFYGQGAVSAVGCKLSLANMMLRFKLMWLKPPSISFEHRNTARGDASIACPDAPSQEEDILLCYHALAMVSCYSSSAALTNHYAMRGLLHGATFRDNGPLLRGKRGVLYILSDIARGNGMMCIPEVDAIIREGRTLFPSDGSYIERFATIYFANSGQTRNLEHRLSGTSRVSFSADLTAHNALVLGSIVAQGLGGQPDEAVKRLQSLARQASTMQDQRTETYCFALSLYFDIFVTGSATTETLKSGQARIAARVRGRQLGMSEWSGGNMSDEKKDDAQSIHADRPGEIGDGTLLALCEAVVAAVNLRLDRPQESFDRAEAALEALRDIKDVVPSTYKALAVHATLECLLDDANAEYIQKGSRQTFELLDFLEAMEDDVAVAAPAHHLMLAMYHVKVQKDCEMGHLLLCRAADCARGMRIPYFAARAYAAQTLTVPTMSLTMEQAAAHKIKELYTRAGTAKHLQEYYGLPQNFYSESPAATPAATA